MSGYIIRGLLEFFKIFQGLVSRTLDRSFSSEPAVLVPVALLPSPFPKELYDQAVEVQKALSELYFRVSCDHQFLMDSLKVCILWNFWLKNSGTSLLNLS